MKPDLHKDALYGLAGDIVMTLAPHSEAHPAALLFQIFVFFVNLTGRGPSWQIEGKDVPLILFVLLVGPTATGRKGSSLGYIKRIFKEVDHDWFNRCIAAGLSSGEGLIAHVRDAQGEDPGVPDKRCLVIEEEFGSVLKVIRRDGNTLSAILRLAWDGENFNVLTRNSPLKATKPFVCVIGHITQKEFERYLDETEIANGFGNRFLIVAVERSKVLPFGGSLTDEDLQPFIERLKEAVAFARRTISIDLDEDAKQLWVEHYEDLTTRPGDLIGAMTARAAAQVRRLACVVALMDLSPTVKRIHLQAAFGAWRYSELSCRQLFGHGTGNVIADKIYRALLTARSLTRTEISNQVLKNNYEKADLDEAIEVLRKLRLISLVTERPERWEIVGIEGSYAASERTKTSTDQEAASVIQ